MDADRRVERAAIAGAFARMVADPAVHRRHRVVPHQRLPRLAILPRLGEPQPRLDVLACGAGVVAGRQQIDIDRMGGARRSGFAPVGHVDQRAHVADAVVHAGAFAVWIIAAAARLALPVSRRKQASTIANTIPATPNELAFWNTVSVSLPPPARSFSSQP